MPGLDRTGPQGQGSQTGRKLGKCNPDNRVDQENKNDDNSGVDVKRKAGNESNNEQDFGDGRGTKEERRAHDLKGVTGPWGGGRGPAGGRGRGRGRGPGGRGRGQGGGQ